MFEKGNLVRWVNEQDGGPVHRVTRVFYDGMIEVHDIAGFFADHLFVLANDIGDIPPGQPPMNSREERLALLLSQGLDLCLRARNLDDQAQRSIESDMGRIFPEGVRCGTPALWAIEQYDCDLGDWEQRAKALLGELGYAG